MLNELVKLSASSCGSPTAVLLALGTSLLVWGLVQYYLLDALRKIPGPALARFSSLWKYNVVCKSEMPWKNAELHEQYGSLVRLGPSHVSANTIDAMETIYVQKKGFPKSGIYTIFQPYWEGKPLHNIFSTQDVAYHTVLKRNLGHLYNMSAIIEMEAKVDEALGSLVKRLGEFTKSGPALVDLSAWLQYYTFDAQALLNFSAPIGFLEQGKDVGGFCHIDHEMMTYFAKWGQIPEAERVVTKIKSLLFKAEGNNPLYDFVLSHIQERLANPSGDKDFLNAVLESRDKNPGTITMREVIAAVYINIVTGHDVTAIQFRALVYYISRTRHVYDKLRAEIDDQVHQGLVSSPANYSEVCNLPYLNAVIQETLRIHPSAGLILERLVPEDGVHLNGHFIPAGTTVGVNAWAINRNKDIFGADVEAFRPERWLDASPDQLRQMRRAMFTFGAGARGCIGKNMAMLQLLKVTFELFRRFDVTWPDASSKWEVVGGWLTRQTVMDMELCARA